MRSFFHPQHDLNLKKKQPWPHSNQTLSVSATMHLAAEEFGRMQGFVESVRSNVHKSSLLKSSMHSVPVCTRQDFKVRTPCDHLVLARFARLNCTALPPHTTHTPGGAKNWPGNIRSGTQGQGNKRAASRRGYQDCSLPRRTQGT